MNKLSAPTGIARASPESATIISMSTISAKAVDEVADMNTAEYGGLAKKKLAA